MSLPKSLTFVDVETTGCRIADRVIEIGALRVEDGKVVSWLNTLVNPFCRVPDEILEMTGISATELESAPSFNSIKKELLEILDDSVFVAHNVRFDYSFVRNEFKREEIGFKSKHFCSVKLSRALFPQFRHHNLDSLIERYGFKCKRRHRAFDDALVLWQFYQLIQKMFTKEQLEVVMKQVLKQPSVPLNLAKEVLDGLPESPGVYIFYGKGGMPLYVGKSVSIRDRVLSHFSSDHISSTEMNIAQQVESIEAIETAGELGALILESKMVKKLQPLYNRKLRHSRLMMVLKSELSKMGYKKVFLDSADNIDPRNLDEVLGIFRNKRLSRDFLVFLAKEFSLCEKLLGVDNTNQACFGYRLGRCKGACIEKENPALYNLRFLEAFQKTKLRPWPFEGAIMIKEKNDLNEKEEGFLVDKWCLLGSVKDQEGVLNEQFNFDLDTYKILLCFLANKKNAKNIAKYKKENNLLSCNLDSDFLPFGDDKSCLGA